MLREDNEHLTSNRYVQWLLIPAMCAKGRPVLGSRPAQLCLQNVPSSVSGGCLVSTIDNQRSLCAAFRSYHLVECPQAAPAQPPHTCLCYHCAHTPCTHTHTMHTSLCTLPLCIHTPIPMNTPPMWTHTLLCTCTQIPTHTMCTATLHTHRAHSHRAHSLSHLHRALRHHAHSTVHTPTVHTSHRHTSHRAHTPRAHPTVHTPTVTPPTMHTLPVHTDTMLTPTMHTHACTHTHHYRHPTVHTPQP